MNIITGILLLTGIYLVAGFVFAILFSWKGAAATDEGAADAGWGFRIIIIPGTMVFWPFLLRKWIKAIKKNKQG